MRHLKKKGTLGRAADHRKALLRNLATSFFLEGSIKTTQAKAKALVPYLEKIFTAIKDKEPREVTRYLKKIVYTKESSKKVTGGLIKKLKNKQSGRLRMLNVGYRKGDNAPLVKIELNI